MLDSRQVPQVDSDELLARFIVYSKHLRSSDRSIKPDAFIPHPHRDLSVTRHRSATDDELWAVGRDVAAASGKTLHGRGDIVAQTCLTNGLTVNSAPVEGNPNHADVRDWPADKPTQKMIAMIIAAKATLAEIPS
jgi:hypothetical protein